MKIEMKAAMRIYVCNNHLQILKLCTTLFQRYSYESGRSDDLLKVTEQVCGRGRNRNCILRVRTVSFSWASSTNTALLHDVALPQAVKEVSLALHAGFKNLLLHLQNCLSYINFSQINITKIYRNSGWKVICFLCVGEESVG